MTDGEVALARSVFGDAVDYVAASVSPRRWWPFQPRDTAMAPRGCIHFNPRGDLYREDFSACDDGMRGFFLHELTHVWQHQRGVCLPLARHPFCRYDYAIRPGWTLARYGIEQQAEIVRHAFLLRRGHHVAGAPPVATYDGILPFRPGADDRLS